jgi:hypothetical protein
MRFVCFITCANVRNGQSLIDPALVLKVLLRVITLGSQIDGNEWQDFVVNLLFMRYAVNLKEIPDDHKGDGGLEAYSLDGHAFQCYAPEGFNSVAQLADKHKAKITKDLNKFKIISKVSPLLGTTKISRWLLVIPDHCSAEVVIHCNKKTEEIKNLSPPLPYITNDFHALAIAAHRFFSAEIAELASKGGFQVEAAEHSVPDTELTLFSEQNNQWTENLDRKLRKLPILITDDEVRELSTRLLTMYLEGSNAVQFYEDNFPNIADRVRFLRQQRAKALEIDSKLQPLTIAGTRDSFESELATSVPSLGRSTARILSYAAVAEWLMRCPLDPKG